MARTPQEIFEHHATALIAGDIDGIVADYADDATFGVPVQVFEDDILFLQWSAVSEKSRIPDGVDTFVFRDGLIRVQTLFHTLEAIP